MRKLAFATLVASMFVLASLVSIPAVSADYDEPKPLLCTVSFSIDLMDPDAHWVGSVAGDVEGTIEIWENWAEYFVVGKAEHFFENFSIYTDDSNFINGTDKGIWTFATLKFRATGFVTDAFGDWSYLAGYKVMMRGFTSEFPPTPPSTNVTASGMMMFAPP